MIVDELVLGSMVYVYNALTILADLDVEVDTYNNLYCTLIFLPISLFDIPDTGETMQDIQIERNHWNRDM